MMAIGIGASWAAGTLCVIAMAAIVLFDRTARLIPRFLCWLLAGGGIVFQYCTQGQSGVMAGLCWAIALFTLAVIAALLVERRRGRGRSIGGGDMRCMAALSLATGASAPWGFTACFVAAVLWSIAARLRGRLLPGEPFAFAPFLAIWLAVGLIASVI